MLLLTNESKPEKIKLSFQWDPQLPVRNASFHGINFPILHNEFLPLTSNAPLWKWFHTIQLSSKSISFHQVSHIPDGLTFYQCTNDETYSFCSLGDQRENITFFGPTTTAPLLPNNSKLLTHFESWNLEPSGTSPNFVVGPEVFSTHTFYLQNNATHRLIAWDSGPSYPADEVIWILLILQLGYYFGGNREKPNTSLQVLFAFSALVFHFSLFNVLYFVFFVPISFKYWNGSSTNFILESILSGIYYSQHGQPSELTCILFGFLLYQSILKYQSQIDLIVILRGSIGFIWDSYLVIEPHFSSTYHLNSMGMVTVGTSLLLGYAISNKLTHEFIHQLLNQLNAVV